MADTKTNIRWAYMDHWRVDSAQGEVSKYSSVKRLDSFVKQVAAVGFEAIETFDFNLGTLRDLFGSLAGCRSFLQDRGIDKVVSLFHGVNYDERQSAPHVRATHDFMFNYAHHIMKTSAGLGVENLIVMPAALYFDAEPVTDDKIMACAELWNRIGKMTRDFGVRLCAHHEFFCALKTPEELRKFYEWTDPKYVFFYCDTAQHTIAGINPVDLYAKLHDRCGGFHLKDTHDVDTTGDYRRRPDAEVMAPTTARWFWEMGTREGLVDFPALMRAMKEFKYRGWVSVEHDKADLGGSNYPESTAVAAWYVKHVLKPIYS